MLHREGRHRTGARVFLFRGRTRRRSAAKLLTRDEARPMAVNFAKLPLLRLSKPYAHRGEPAYGLVHHTG